jgi:hypothetical protein
MPRFSLCGLNCGLCPQYHGTQASRCPGCGGPDFYLKHPSCAVITCSRKHEEVEFCFQCSCYPCGRYAKPSDKDSFITYRNVLSDFDMVQSGGIDRYAEELDEKAAVLAFLLEHFNDGRRKSFYCLAANLLSLGDLRDVLSYTDAETGDAALSRKDRIERIVSALEDKAKQKGITLKLRK